MPITIADVAARAKVSKTTVSRVLNGKGELDESTAARVRKVIDELGYVPSSRAVGLARGRTRVVGMLVPSLTWPWIGEVLQGAVDVLETERYGLLLFTCNRGEESMRQFGAQVSAKSFDGLLVIEPEGTLDYIATLHARGPAGGADRRPGHQPGQIPSVGTTNHDRRRRGRPAPAVDRPPPAAGDHRAGSTSAAPSSGSTGFASVYAEAGHPIPAASVLPGDFTFDCGFEGVQPALETGVEFDAVFAHNDLSATGAMQARAGQRPPHPAGRGGGRLRRHPAWRRTPSRRSPPCTNRCARWARPRHACCSPTSRAHPCPTVPTVIPTTFIGPRLHRRSMNRTRSPGGSHPARRHTRHGTARPPQGIPLTRNQQHLRRISDAAKEAVRGSPWRACSPPAAGGVRRLAERQATPTAARRPPRS